MRKDTEASSIQSTMNTTITLGVPDLVTNSYIPALAALGEFRGIPIVSRSAYLA